jgi:hypothetical protein
MRWDLIDNVDTQFIACRLGRVALFALLGDGGAQQNFEDEYDDIKDMPLHPIQFRELCARFSYRSTLATRTPKYFTIQGTPHEVHQIPLGGFSLEPLFKDGNAEGYARCLQHYTELPLESIFEPPDKVATWLRKPTGEPNFMNVADYPCY